jgi:hypothetical protein
MYVTAWLQSRELREKRAQYLQQQAALKEAEAAKRCAGSYKTHNPTIQQAVHGCSAEAVACV